MDDIQSVYLKVDSLRGGAGHGEHRGGGPGAGRPRPGPQGVWPALGPCAAPGVATLPPEYQV